MARKKKKKQKEDDPNLLHESSYILFTRKPNVIGLLLLDTDEGIFECAINRTVAEILRNNLDAFLNGEPSPAQGTPPVDDA